MTTVAPKEANTSLNYDKNTAIDYGCKLSLVKQIIPEKKIMGHGAIRAPLSARARLDSEYSMSSLTLWFIL